MKDFRLSGLCLVLAVVFVLGIGGAAPNASAAYYSVVQIQLNNENMTLAHTTRGLRDRSWISTDPAVADLPLWWSLDGGTTWNILYDIENEQPVPNFGPLGNAAGDILTIAACGQQVDPPTPLIPGGDVSPTSSAEINIAWDEYHGSGTINGNPWTIDLSAVSTTLTVVSPSGGTISPASLCEGDFAPSDGDVDGSDLAWLIAHLSELDLSVFAGNFGRENCPAS